MIISSLSGGMGNQMFQYAIGRCLAHSKQTQLKLNISFFENYDWHEYSLQPLNIAERIASPSELRKFPWRTDTNMGKLKRFFKANFFDTVIANEKHFQFDESIFSLRQKHILLSGYWQSEKYFKLIEGLIRKEFVVIEKPSPENQALLQEIQDKQSVSLHIRRGNYVSIKEVNEVLSPCPPDYYERAVSIIQQRIENPTFFIFSDEIEWAKQHLRINAPVVFVEHNDGTSDYEDLRLMYSCKHNITANSSFSWWGAWLNKNPSKIVISPKRWFNDASVNTKDLQPEEWIKI